ncbi:MAG: hypothetical protein ACK559_15435, partial [bacterium]
TDPLLYMRKFDFLFYQCILSLGFGLAVLQVVIRAVDPSGFGSSKTKMTLKKEEMEKFQMPHPF